MQPEKYRNLVEEAEANSDLLWSFSENVGMPVECIKYMHIIRNMSFNDMEGSTHFEMNNKALCIVPKIAESLHGFPAVIIYVDGSLPKEEKDGCA